jgi:hypothetical protein
MTSAPPHPAAAAAAATPWHLAGSLVSLRNGVNAHWPKRDKRSDGGIGDARHLALPPGSTDHAPWLNNTVRAYDFDTDGIDAAWFAEQLRLAGLAGDRRLAGRTGSTDDNGYVIHNRHITAPDFSRWVAYDGEDPHTGHVHVSVTRDPGGYEDASPWTFLAAAPLLPHTAPAPAPAPAAPAGYGAHNGNSAHAAPYPDADPIVDEPGFPDPGADAIGTGAGFRAQYGNQGERVGHLQLELNRVFPAYSGLTVDGIYGRETAAVLEELAYRAAQDPNTPHEDVAGLSKSDGNSVGPRLARCFLRYGVQV